MNTPLYLTNKNSSAIYVVTLSDGMFVIIKLFCGNNSEFHLGCFMLFFICVFTASIRQKVQVRLRLLVVAYASPTTSEPVLIPCKTMLNSL